MDGQRQAGGQGTSKQTGRVGSGGADAPREREQASQLSRWDRIGEGQTTPAPCSWSLALTVIHPHPQASTSARIPGTRPPISVLLSRKQGQASPASSIRLLCIASTSGAPQPQPSRSKASTHPQSVVRLQAAISPTDLCLLPSSPATSRKLSLQHRPRIHPHLKCSQQALVGKGAFVHSSSIVARTSDSQTRAQAQLRIRSYDGGELHLPLPGAAGSLGRRRRQQQQHQSYWSRWGARRFLAAPPKPFWPPYQYGKVLTRTIRQFQWQQQLCKEGWYRAAAQESKQPSSYDQARTGCAGIRRRQQPQPRQRRIQRACVTTKARACGYT